MVWKPSVTVAAVVEQDGRFLVVEERTSRGRRFNQPAGHLEPNETLADASAREALEETAYTFVPQYLVGIYRWRYAPKEVPLGDAPEGTPRPEGGATRRGGSPLGGSGGAPKGITYLRFAFGGRITGHDPGRALDKGILRAAWLTLDELRACAGRHRSPLVLCCAEDYLAGRRYPLELITHYP